MAKDFNVYQWRREHLNENRGEEFSTKQYREDNKVNNFTQGEKNDYLSTRFKDEKGKSINISTNEGEGDLKVSTITFDQANGMKLPYDITGGAYIEILRPNVFDEWKDRFIRIYGDADLKANGDRLIASSEKVDALQARAASDIRGAVGTVD
jgi:hypothetical protein